MELTSKNSDSVPLESPFQVICNICEKRFVSGGNKERHMRNVHKILPLENARMKLKCSECLNIFSSHSNFIKHLTESHEEINCRKDILQFPDVNSFESWKMEIEKETVSKYLLKKRYKNTSGKMIAFYNCHRSGYFTSHSKGIRRLKEGGSFKIGSYCPARIKSEVPLTPDNSKVVVEYCSTHIGHDCDISYIRLSKSEKNDIADMLEADISISNTSIMKETRKRNMVAVEKKKKSSKLEKLKEDLRSTLLGFLPVIENIEKEETCKNMLASLTSLKHTYETLESQNKQLSLNLASNANAKKLQPQGQLPEKKKRVYVKKK